MVACFWAANLCPHILGETLNTESLHCYMILASSVCREKDSVGGIGKHSCTFVGSNYVYMFLERREIQLLFGIGSRNRHNNISSQGTRLAQFLAMAQEIDHVTSSSFDFGPRSRQDDVQEDRSEQFQTVTPAISKMIPRMLGLSSF